MTNNYCSSLTTYLRRKTITATIGDVPMGSDYPIRVQSMTTIDTMDTMGSVEQAIRMVASGCEYVRITAPSVKEAQNLENIRKELKRRGYNVPLIADIHFTPNAAELAARIVEKVRINPGNYADKKRFEIIDYSDATYEAELLRIRERFLPLIKICKTYGTAMRIGTNHGSLSDRILSRYGDTPLGMVESALEFLRICEDENYYNIVLSMKSSNPQVMVQAYRLLSARLAEEKLKPYPLHLGVTEAGEGEDGRIKSALGIGTLLEDGLGDTVRVSLTEDPEFEAPVAKTLIDRYKNRAANSSPITEIYLKKNVFTPFQYHKRATVEVLNWGAKNVPRVIADFSDRLVENHDDLKAIGHFYLPLPDKWRMNDTGADYIYTGKIPAKFMLPNGLKEIIDYEVWQNHSDKINKFPLLKCSEYLENNSLHKTCNFLTINKSDLNADLLKKINTDKTLVLIINSSNSNAMQELRYLCFILKENECQAPIVIQRKYKLETVETFQLYASTDVGGLLIDGFGDGIMFSYSDIAIANATAFNILQAARTRISKTEYISCPSCGRTLFDLQETTAMIRKKTDHLKGVKIGIMGCIVNGPGEMADADYGYVGIGKDKIALYRGQHIIKKSVVAAKAVDELIELIKEDSRWFEPELHLEN